MVGWMRFREETTHETLPASKAEVVQAILDLLPRLRVRVTSLDRARGTITGVTGMSPFSLGEVLTLQVKELAPDHCVLVMTSRLKGLLNPFGAYRHQYNFMALREAVWDVLLDGPVPLKPEPAADALPPPPPEAAAPSPATRPAAAPGE